MIVVDTVAGRALPLLITDVRGDRMQLTHVDRHQHHNLAPGAGLMDVLTASAFR